MNRFPARHLAVALLFLSAGSAQAALTINLTFGPGFNENTQTGAVRRNVANAAAANWMNAFNDTIVDYTVAITVNMNDLSSAGLNGRMFGNAEGPLNATTNTRLPTSGTIELNSFLGGSRTMFFDPTPEEHSEFNMNGLRGNSNGTNPAALGLDALSTLTHEIGHVLGFSGLTGTWAGVPDNQPFLGYTDYINNLNAARTVFTFDTLTSGGEGSINGPMTTVNINAFHLNGSARIMASSRPDGVRQLITPLEVDMLSDAFRLRIPTPGSAVIVASAVLMVSRRRRRSAH